MYMSSYLREMVKAGVASSFWIKFMSVWRVVDVLREVRYLWGSTSDCTGLGVSTCLLLVVLAWIGGLLLGIALTTCFLSPLCRRALVFSLQAVLGALGPVPAVVQRADLVRDRLAAYRPRGE